MANSVGAFTGQKADDEQRLVPKTSRCPPAFPCCSAKANEEIANPQYRRLASAVYAIWLCRAIIILSRFAVIVAAWEVVDNDHEKYINIVVNFLLLFLIPLEYVFFYGAIYKALKLGLPAVIRVITLLFTFIEALGIPYTTPGFINGGMILVANSSTTLGLAIGMACILCGAATLVLLFGLVIVRSKLLSNGPQAIPHPVS